MPEPKPIAEKDVLLTVLRGQREHVLGALEGLSDDDLRRPVLPTGWSCLGLVHHLAVDVERFWFRAVMAGEQVELFEEDGGWTVPEGRTADDVLALYRDEAERSDAVLAAHALDEGPARWPAELFPGLPVRDLRRLALAVITETATHAGHLDAVRELIDGRTWLVLTQVTLVERLRAAGCVFAEEEAELLQAEAATPEQLESLVARRVAGEPLEHVLGWAGFRGLRIAVDPGVFVPRRRTELLVELALPRTRPGDVVVDLCCGSGALGAALATERPGVELVAADLDPAAVRCARRNLEPLGGRVFQGDLFAPLPAGLRGRVGVLLVNVPYVPTEEIALMPPEARLHEAAMALDGGADGLDLLRRVAAEAPGWLAPGGVLLTETSARQAETAVAAVRSGGLAARAVACDEDTAVVGERGR